MSPSAQAQSAQVQRPRGSRAAAVPEADWQADNKDYLTAALDQVKRDLQRLPADGAPARPVKPEPLPACEPPAHLARLVERMGLSRFESNILLLCAGFELDSEFAGLCAQASRDPARGFPTSRLAIALWPELCHWDAFAPVRPLRSHRLLELGAGGSLRLEEWTLHFLTGVSYLDERLAHLMSLVPPSSQGAAGWRQPSGADQVAQHALFIDPALPGSQRALMAQILRHLVVQPVPPVVHLCGEDHSGKRALAAAVCAARGSALYAMNATDVPQAPQDRASLAVLWGREALLRDSVLLIEFDDTEPAEVQRTVQALSDQLSGPLIVTGRDPLRLRQRALVALHVSKPNAPEQRALWRQLLGAEPDAADPLERVVSQFNLSTQSISQIAATVLSRRPAANETSGEQDGLNEQGEAASGLDALWWNACREHNRSRLDDLAQRITPSATWSDLVVPELQLGVLQDITAQLRHRAKVYEDWGFRGKALRGLGLSALFAGLPGTGKTMAAEVLANELELDLYRIDLSSVVSKYIGETEKNLRRVFDAAEEGGAILLFDEADALFGKRSEVKDSHDRYANIEVSYLLQRMEEYRGLAILTTNMKEALDTAFLRRLRFMVQFPFPDAKQRAEIWRRIFPLATPTLGLDPLRLGQLNVAGGNIRNIALNAAFLAAKEDGPVRMRHILRATRSEYAKLEKPLTTTEIGGWSDV